MCEIPKEKIVRRRGTFTKGKSYPVQEQKVVGHKKTLKGDIIKQVGFMTHFGV